MGRINSKNRCPRCKLNGYLCLCAEIPTLPLATKLVVLMHFREARLPTNTANLACLALPHSEIHVRGQVGEPLSVEALELDHSRLALLFPSDNAIELNAETVQQLPRPLTLVVPDGSWRQARKIAWREPALSSALHVKLPPGPPSSYRLRQAAHAQHVSTYEAIARTLGLIEGPAIQERLEALFEMMVERTLWSRGALRAEQCLTGIPAAAIAAQNLAGAAGSPRKAKPVRS